MIFLTLILVPVLIALTAFIISKKQITFTEFAIQIGIQLIIAGISIAIIYNSNTSDIEIWNGKITEKIRDKVHCRHSYSCNCHESCSGSGSSRSCTTICQTCYIHSYDIDWYAKNSLNESIYIDTVDAQGLIQPPRWTNIKIGEPTASKHSYTNYIKGSPNSLFRHQGSIEKYKTKIPNYPDKIYDYYRLNRFIIIDFSLPDIKEWNEGLSNINALLGAKKQVNVIFVFIKNQPDEYFYALEQTWLGGKKNDVVVVISVDDALNIQWVESLAWTANEMVKVKLRDDILALKTLQREPLLNIVASDINQHYIRKPMKDFKYLQASIVPTTFQFVFALIIGILASIGISFFMWTNREKYYEGRF